MRWLIWSLGELVNARTTRVARAQTASGDLTCGRVRNVSAREKEHTRETRATQQKHNKLGTVFLLSLSLFHICHDSPFNVVSLFFSFFFSCSLSLSLSLTVFFSFCLVLCMFVNVSLCISVSLYFFVCLCISLSFSLSLFLYFSSSLSLTSLLFLTPCTLTFRSHFLSCFVLLSHAVSLILALCAQFKSLFTVQGQVWSCLMSRTAC